eukprot:TRINITY_DN8406_c0_g1_i1.p2 TRINITY_DN8406_c0_g1~~TRINITY_DN8406_c0_g1_i1.p2  ORF type:complete len:216 (+),score=71.77 TRINITY_DN8406_c0_g1_i1:151-798(+)
MEASAAGFAAALSDHHRRLVRQVLEMQHVSQFLETAEAALLENETAVLAAQELAWFGLACTLTAFLLLFVWEVVQSLRPAKRTIALLGVYDLEVVDPTDFAATVKFYVDGLGYTLDRDGAPESSLLTLRSDETPHAVIVQSRASLAEDYPEVAAHMARRKGPCRVRYQTIENVDVAVARLKHASATILSDRPHKTTTVREVWYVDPAGNMAVYVE